MKLLRITLTASGLITGLASVAPVQAQMLSEAARACLKVSDDAQRLACFDREIGRLATPSAPAAASAAAEAAAATKAAPPPAVASEAEFGVRGSAVARKQEDEKSQLDSLSARVTNVSTRPRGERVVTLDNDQVWVELKAESYFPVKAGDQVTIQAGTLNSYRMQLPSGRSTHVRRLQ